MKLIKIIILLIIFFTIFFGCTVKKAPKIPLNAAPLGRSEYILTENDIKATAGGWLFFDS